MVTPASSWEKFKLLLWKNWILQWSSKWAVAFETLLPLLYVSLLVAIRLISPMRGTMLKVFEPISLDASNETDISDKKLYYSPKNPILDDIVKAAVELLNMESFEAFNNAGALESALLENNVTNGIQFDDSMRNISEIPPKLKYAIRQNAANSIWLAKRLFRAADDFQWRTADDDHDFQYGKGYIQKGFLSIQHAVSMAYLKMANKTVEFPEIVVQRFPYPAYLSDNFLFGLPVLLTLILVLCFVYPAGILVKNITIEKERQLKEIMKMMGLPNWIHWSAWFMRAFIPWGISTLLIVMLLKIPVKGDQSCLVLTSWSVLLCFLLIYLGVSICYCFMFAIFFKNPSTAAAVGSTIWFMQLGPFFLYKTGSFGHSSAVAKWLCLLPNSALGMGIDIFLKYEMMGEGLQWRHIFTPPTPDDQALGPYIGVMLLSALIYMLICLYVEQIYPGEYGVPKKWYFLLTKNYWFGEKYKDVYTETSELKSKQQNSANFEPEPVNKNAGLKARNLKKKFGSKLVVKNLNFNMYEDEITVLLGHNGAGKTTTISMLCGMFPPTSGTAIVNGYNINTHTEEARSSMGICPQHNVLFDEMSVANHIIFYSRLKGVRCATAIGAEVQQYLKILGFENKANEKAKSLSGGMKRKLSLCCAFCGNSKVVLCDEPSSGMDPASRRQLWELMQAEKIGRTILLTTHFMDEADALGDRIAIMCNGELKCYGSSFFLKKKYGSGYKLICVKRENCKEEEVTACLQQLMPRIKPESDIGAELTYLLPEAHISEFEGVLAALEQNSNELNLSGYGIGISSMEEVFMKVGAENLKNLAGTTYGGTLDGSGLQSLEAAQENNFFMEHESLLQGKSLFQNQFLAMLLKHALITWRSKFAFLAQLLVSIGVILLVIKKPTTEPVQSEVILLKPIKLDLNLYPEETTVLEFQSIYESNNLAWSTSQNYKELLNAYGPNYNLEETHENSFEDYMISLGKTKQFEINSKYLTAASITGTRNTAWFNFQAFHSAPLSLNLMHNAMARALLGPSAEIIVTNAPLPLVQVHNVFEFNEDDIGFILNKILCSIMCFLTAFYVAPALKERVSRAKLLQLVSGVGARFYWFMRLLWDLTIFLFITTACLATVAIFQLRGYSTFTELGLYFLLFISFGLSALPFAYVISLFSEHPATGFSRSFSLNIFTGLIFYMVFKSQEGSEYSETVLDVFRLFPHFALAIGLEKLYSNSGDACTILAEMDADPVVMDTVCKTIASEVLYLLATGGFFLLIIVLSEFNVVASFMEGFRNAYRKKHGMVNLDSTNDVEGNPSRKRLTPEEIMERNLVVDSVTKFYGSFKAVDQVQFDVKSSECFGLLGVNGAGKTTIFKMLTGEEVISFGDIFVKGLSVKRNLNRVYKEIGYCPQFDALISDLTGRETLRIFCLLRGVPVGKINGLITDLSEAFGFTKHLDKFTAKYSGGNKRKLSTALAVLGGPSVVYLDEPTSGMDPAARRQLWNMVCRIRDAGKSIVLTSHSMEECEALCTRLAIMVNGEFKCIGSTQHLKNLYSKGLILKLKIKRAENGITSSFSNDSLTLTNERSRLVGIIKEFVELQFPNSELHEEFQDILTFHIPLASVKWSEIFGIMERNRLPLNIEDYSISQTTLEEIFLDFAKLQREDKRICG